MYYQYLGNHILTCTYYQPTNDQESSSSEEMDDHWDDDPRNPFSASFVVEEDHPAQSVCLSVN